MRTVPTNGPDGARVALDEAERSSFTNP